MNKWIAVAIAALAIAGFAFYFMEPGKAGNETAVRIGFFPNMLHAQALVGRANGTFTRALGPGTEMVPFNAGPSVIEALFADQVDIAYIGPNPAINGFVKSEGKALRIISGAASGGAVLVVRNDSGITKDSDFAGKKIASPQLGNTQDVALRAYMQDAGLKIGEGPGEVSVIPTANPDILTSFQKKEIDGAWVPEPWGARLVQEGGGRIYLDERSIWPGGKFVTANIIVSRKFLDEHPDKVESFLRAHVELTDWINTHPDEAKGLMNAQIKNLTGKELPRNVLDEAFSRCEITYDPVESSLEKSADDAFALGFLGSTRPDLSGIYDLAILDKILEGRRK
ncbi:MAG TPA: ABC transporter substrate-binding protein [Candidatus Bilamarchaeum sp.]|nr:ABC transporter substrate-binding protein [Candidatus Bilamarchaeum sp.]